MIMAYIQDWLVRRRRVSGNPSIEMEQVPKVTSGSHRQPLGNPADRHRSFGAETGSQPDLERMALAPSLDLLLPNPGLSQRLSDQALRLGYP